METNCCAIPEELWYIIIGYLHDSAESIASASVASKQFHNIVKTDKDLRGRLDQYIKSKKLFVPDIYSRLIKIAVTGRDGSGKSSLVAAFLGDQAQPTCSDPFDSATYHTNLEVDGERYTLEIVDMVHPEEYNTYRSHHYYDAHGIVGVYTITDYDGSIDMLNRYLDAAREVKENKKFPLIIVGNMNDLESTRRIGKSEGQALAEEFGAEWSETNYRDKETIDDIFMTLVRSIIHASKPRWQPKADPKKENNRTCVII